MIEKSAEIDRMISFREQETTQKIFYVFLFLIKRNDFNLNELIKLKMYIKKKKRNIKLGIG